MGNQGSELVPFRYNAYDLTVQFNATDQHSLSIRHLKGIYNAWHRAVQVDSYGRLWIDESELHNILRTTRDQASYFTLSIPDKYKASVGGSIYIQGSEVFRILDSVIQSSGSSKRERYARFSEEIYRTLRDSDKLKTIRYEFYERISSHRKELKKIRIKQLKLKKDELTGETLAIRSSEFSHIRSAKVYLALADKYWNGLIVNKNTHEIITQAGVNDEEQLHDLCIDQGWNTGWYADFVKCLSSALY